LLNYEIIKWNADNFDINSVKWVKQAVEHEKWAFATDYIRFWLLYNYGGIYLDCDVELLRPFGNDLMKLPYFLGMEKTKGIIEAAVLGAAPKTEWVRECMNYYLDREFVLKGNKLDTLTLPYIMLKTLKKKYGLKLLSKPSDFNKDEKLI
jgi:mannosyltransferase OCH1-like enzyme